MARKTISLLTLVSFLLLLVSSVVLYVLPGRGAPPEAANFLSLNKHVWKNLHITGGFLFIAVGIWHTVLNARALSNYLKRSARLNFKAVIPLGAALAITAFVYAGTVCEIAPMRAVLDFGKTVSVGLAQKTIPA